MARKRKLGWLGLGAAAAGLWYLFGRQTDTTDAPDAPKGSGLKVPKSGGEPSKYDDYIRYMYARQLKYLPKLKAHYNLDRLRRITRAAARSYAVPPEWVWGTMYGESKWYPIGVYAHSADKAIARRSNAYGMGQFMRSRFDSEKSREAGGRITWKHADLLEPKLSVWSTAASLGRLVAKYGGGPSKTAAQQAEGIRRALAARDGLAVGHWWAGYGTTPEGKLKALAGAAKKMRHIRDRGGEVHRVGTSNYSGRPAGPTSAADDVAPWGGGKVLGLLHEAPKVATDPIIDLVLAAALADWKARSAQQAKDEADYDLVIGPGEIVG